MRQPESEAFVWPVRVYYEDTDVGGVVYYANYLKFMERARTEYLRQLGFEQDQLIADPGILFAVREVQVDYLSPARFNEDLRVTAQVQWVKRASLEFYQTVQRTDTEYTLCKGRVRLSCIDAELFRPTAIPKLIKDALHS